MFEREIQFIYDFSHNKIKKLGSFITFYQLKSTNLHPAILQYVSAEIDFYIFEDRQKLLKDSLFDYSGPKINSYFMMISEEIKKTKKFSQSYIEKLILHSVTFTVNHLVNPNKLISQFIFEEENEKSAAEIKQILNYLHYYPHTKKIISSYLDKKNLVRISSEEFGELLKKIDNIGFTENPEKIYNEALESMADFFNIGMPGRTMVPLQAVESYLKDKGLNIHLDKLKSEFVDDEITRYEIKDFQKILLGNEPVEAHTDKSSDTEEVLESDLENSSTETHVFEPVEGEEHTVELKIKGEDAPKVILDEETVAETEEKPEDQSDDTGEETESAAADDKKESVPVTDAAEVDTTDEEADNIPDESTSTDTDFIEIEDERELENEAVAEVMELAKEEVNIEGDDNIEGKELIADEDDPLGVIDEIDSETAEGSEEKKIDGEQDSSAVDGSLDENKGNEILEGDQSAAEDQKHPLGFQAGSDEPEADSQQISSEEVEKNSEVDGIDLTQNETAPQAETDEFNSESKDTLSYLLNDDPVEEDPDTDSFEIKDPDNIEENKITGDDLELFEKEMTDSAEVEQSEKEEPVSQKEEPVSQKEEPASPKIAHIDITSLLENKKITKVIDAIFDYDMEEFANTIERISEAPSLDSANQIIDKVCGASQISITSKEAKLFKGIISDYYDRK